MRSPSPMLAPIGVRGSSDANGSWKMICIRRRNGLSLLPLERRDVGAVEHDAARGRLDQPQQRAADRRLATARLADEAERLAATDREADVVDRLHVADLAVHDAADDREVLAAGARPRRGVVALAAAVMRVASPALSGRSRTAAVGVVVDPAAHGVVVADRAQLGMAARSASSTSYSIAGVQRGAKRHASGRSIRFGTLPGMSLSSSRSSPSARHRADQAPRVRMLRVVEEVGDVALLDDLAGVHHRHPVAHLGHDAEVVGDQDHRGVRLALERPHEVEDLGLDRDVERGRRLVGDQQLRLAGQRHGDHHALRHAARQLVRKRVEPALRVGDADHLEQLQRALPARPCASSADAARASRRPACRRRRPGSGCSSAAGRSC